MNIFYAYSNFTDYHPILLTSKIGDTCVMIIEYELQRYVTRVHTYQQQKMMCESTGPNAEVDLGELRKNMKKEEKRLSQMICKQEKVLFVAIHLLMNLAEDLQIEKKMKNRDIIKLLLILIERNNPDLIYISLNFLKKLSVFGSNKNQMVELDIVKKLNRFIPC